VNKIDLTEDFIKLQLTILEIESIRTSREKVLAKIDNILANLKSKGQDTKMWEEIKRRINIDDKAIH